MLLRYTISISKNGVEIFKPRVSEKLYLVFDEQGSSSTFGL
jgi:hypothetical protein